MDKLTRPINLLILGSLHSIYWYLSKREKLQGRNVKLFEVKERFLSFHSWIEARCPRDYAKICNTKSEAEEKSPSTMAHLSESPLCVSPLHYKYPATVKVLLFQELQLYKAASYRSQVIRERWEITRLPTSLSPHSTRLSHTCYLIPALQGSGDRKQLCTHVSSSGSF